MTYSAWFDDPARLERLAAPVASFAWSVEASAELVGLGVDGPVAHFVLSPLTPAEVSAFRQRFAPSRDRLSHTPARPGAPSWLARSAP